MDNELVSSSESDNDSVVTRGGETIPIPHSFSEMFWLKFPYYLSIGMTEEQYWDGDPLLTKSYREAEEIRTDKMNQQAWLQGMYVYDAILRTSPVLHAFGKKGAKPKPYPEEPYPLNEKKREEIEEKKEKAQSDKGLLHMRNFMAANNKHFEERK